MQAKTKKILNIVLNVLVCVILALALIVTINTVINAKKGYTPFFGKAAMAVQSPSMDGGGSFAKGDIIFVQIYKSAEEKEDLRVGDVVTFWTEIEHKRALNSHRIVRYVYKTGGNGTEYQEGNIEGYFTKGDNNSGVDDDMLYPTDIVGKYTGKKIAKLGYVGIFFNSPTGFLICVVVPSLLVVAYCVYLVVKAVKGQKAGVTAEDVSEVLENDELREAVLAKEKERLRAELLEEMKREQEQNEPNHKDADGGPGDSDRKDE